MNIVPIVMVFDKTYLIPALVAIKSMIDTTRDRSRIEIFIFHRDISPNIIELVKKMVSSYGCVISFIDMSKALEGIAYKKSVSEEIFYPLFIPSYFSGYDSVISLDVDVLVRDDILLLSDEMPSDKKVGGVPCLFRNYTRHGDFCSMGRYAREVVGVEDIKTYFNGGVVVFNNKNITDQERRDCILLMEKQWDSNEESVLNYVFQGAKHMFSLRWNFQMEQEGEYPKYFPAYLRDDFVHSRNDIAICHFMGRSKPWKSAHCKVTRRYIDEYHEVCRQVMCDIEALAPKILCGPMWTVLEEMLG